MDAVVLPKLVQLQSPNQSARTWPIHDRPIFVFHETAGSYAGAVSWMAHSTSEISAHFCLREDGMEATQLVPLSRKAWTEAAYNYRGISLEIADTTGRGFQTEKQLRVAARIAAWTCWKFGIPPRWTKDGSRAGICRHRDLGIAGGGHPLCGPAGLDWERLLGYIGHEVARGDFRPNWAKV